MQSGLWGCWLRRVVQQKLPKPQYRLGDRNRGQHSEWLAASAVFLNCQIKHHRPLPSCGILGVESHGQNILTALLLHGANATFNGWVAITHGPIYNNIRVVDEGFLLARVLDCG